ncbi:MAG: hypothetical protein EA397_14115 [Deltaproteobacteria bacterium]|nr:MAG: hypothetical protein EA397_14115 [Deltaproteobacteria bacterium]
MIQEGREPLWGSLESFVGLSWPSGVLLPDSEPVVAPDIGIDAPQGLGAFIEGLAELAGRSLPVGVRFILSLRGHEPMVWTVDAASTGAVVRRGDAPWFDGKLDCTADSLTSMLEGRACPMALLDGRQIHMEGDVGLWLRLCAAWREQVCHGAPAAV